MTASKQYLHIYMGFPNFRSALGEETQKFLTEPSRAWMESTVSAHVNISKSQILDLTRINKKIATLINLCRIRHSK